MKLSENVTIECKVTNTEPEGIQIFAIDEHNYTEEITDLYWFEEACVHQFDEKYSGYKFSIVITIHDSNLKQFTE